MRICRKEIEWDEDEIMTSIPYKGKDAGRKRHKKGTSKPPQGGNSYKNQK